MITAIVLAGGRSSRFGEDKLAAAFDHSTVLGATIRAVEALVDGVIVAGHALPRGFRGGDVPVALVSDRAQFDGPLRALADVLATASDDGDGLAIVVGGDMPRLVPAVLARMLDTLDADPTVDAVYLGRREREAAPAAIAAEIGEPPRRRQVLPLALRVQPASRAAREAVQAGRRSLQALVDQMTAVELPADVWLRLDPAGATLVDVDTRADLDRLNAP